MAQKGTAASINLGELEKLAAMQCTDEEIAAWFGVSIRTIERRRKSPVFCEVIERGKAKGRISLRRAQLRMLENGSAAIAIWLGKQYLHQAEEPIDHAVVPLMLVLPKEQLPQAQVETPPAVIDVKAIKG